jgi:hypothetical protein
VAVAVGTEEGVDGMVEADGMVVGGTVVGMAAAGAGAGMAAGGMEAVGGGPGIGALVIILIGVGAILIGAGAAVTGVAGAVVTGAVGVVATGAVGMVATVTGVAGAAATGTSQIGKLPKNLCSPKSCRPRVKVWCFIVWRPRDHIRLWRVQLNPIGQLARKQCHEPPS